jgi:hypothetical protein
MSRIKLDAKTQQQLNRLLQQDKSIEPVLAPAVIKSSGPAALPSKRCAQVRPFFTGVAFALKLSFQVATVAVVFLFLGAAFELPTARTKPVSPISFREVELGTKNVFRVAYTNIRANLQEIAIQSTDNPWMALSNCGVFGGFAGVATFVIYSAIFTARWWFTMIWTALCQCRSGAHYCATNCCCCCCCSCCSCCDESGDDDDSDPSSPKKTQCCGCEDIEMREVPVE